MTGLNVNAERIYLDHASTSPLDPIALEAMLPYLTGCHGNPNSLHREGREAFVALEDSRRSIAKNLGARMPSEVIFTSGGTESDNSALQGIVDHTAPYNGHAHVIVSTMEHHAVLNPAARLAKQGHEVTYLAPRRDGFIYPEDLSAAMRENTVLVSVMLANNEIGTMQPVAELTRIAHTGGALLHTDAVQALGKVPLDLEKLGVDAASFSAHKIGGPKGVGALYLRRKTPFYPWMLGGGQEAGRRSGTQNVAGAVGFAAALDARCADIEERRKELTSMRDRCIDAVLAACPSVSLAVDPRGSDLYLPNIIAFLVDGLEGETTLLDLDNVGIAASAGSACSSESLEPSHVLRSISIPDRLAYGSLRVSLGYTTTEKDINRFIEIIPSIIEKRS